MISTPGMCQAYPAYTSGAPEDVSTALHGSGEGSLCTKCMRHLVAPRPLMAAAALLWQPPAAPHQPLPSLPKLPQRWAAPSAGRTVPYYCVCVMVVNSTKLSQGLLY